MERNTLRFLCLFAFLIFHNVQLTKAISEECAHECNFDEVCYAGVCVKGYLKDTYDYYGDRLRSNEEYNQKNGYDKGYLDRRNDIPKRVYENREANVDSSEPTLEDRTLIKSLPLKDIYNDYRSELGARRGSTREKSQLPPLSSENWDSIRDEVSEGGDHEEKESSLLPPESDFPKASLSEDGLRKNVMPEVHPDSTLMGNGDEHGDMDNPNGKVMIKGIVKKTEKNIDQGPNPEINYKHVKDFFKSQQASSIVDVPKAVKREEDAKLFNTKFVTVTQGKTDEVDKEEDVSGKDRGTVKISLDKKVTGQDISAQMKDNSYTQESGKQVAKRLNEDGSVKDEVSKRMNVRIISADGEVPEKHDSQAEPKKVTNVQPKYFLVTVTVVGCVTGVILAAVAIYLIMKRYNETKKFKPVTLPGQEAAADYQELCRQLRANQGWDSAPVKSGSGHMEKEKGLLGSAKPPKYTWSEEPVVPNMDISTGHVVLSYMEDHLSNKNRLNKEWEALCNYEAEPSVADLGKQDKNVRKNRYSDVLPYDHNRVSLRETANATGSDYINASFITDHDPRNPAYIATQGPLAHTVSDFWQMVWEQGVVVIVNLTRLSDLGLPQCHRYWPEDGHETYHIYEVHLVSEHIWCDDYLVRSFYLKNLQTSETRTVTQFHFLSWPDLNVPTTPKPLLEFRRKVNKCFRGRSCPIVVHCSGGVGRTGCYILIDLVLNKMMRGAKEIDIAATVEHLRDQRPHMVKTKAQFEFALTAVAEEVNAILQALAK
ncbi:receptor-type tyrosine-protein phosphatase N2 isoform X2 [Nematostella vectensis]|uniref:receptor-type tyrosine-protein phosphatase N2 isoform X2 n=1 Tax=Nematostella vectensis TaxID=45351 RepID=UPI0013902266|nr:receptor-type tyrosine-protein phosphatase N2 isoform X2 [Nematostella vectensis]